MATMKIPEYHCPHCNAKLSSMPKGDFITVGNQCYGSVYVPCRKCGKEYRQPFVEEAALNLEEKSHVPLLITSPKILATLIGICTVSAVLFLPAALIVIPVCAAVWFLLGLATRSYRQEHKSRVLSRSRQRLLTEDTYLLRLLGTGRKAEDLAVLYALLPQIKRELRSCFDLDSIPNLHQILAHIGGGQ